MVRKRMTIAGLICAIGGLALGFAAVGVASPAWAGAVASLTFFSLISALLGIGLGRGSRRVFWTGYALLGWAYLVIVDYHLFGDSGRYFLAPRIVATLYDSLHSLEGVGYEQLTGGMGGFGGMGGGIGGGMRSMPLGGAPTSPMPTPRVDPADFYCIIRYLEVLLWATLGVGSLGTSPRADRLCRSGSSPIAPRTRVLPRGREVPSIRRTSPTRQSGYANSLRLKTIRPSLASASRRGAAPPMAPASRSR